VNLFRTMKFRFEGKTYHGKTATEIIRAIQRDKHEPLRRSEVRDFISWAVSELEDLVPQRDLDFSERLSDETLALNYIYLCDEYGLGKVLNR
jgi:hypothetical protein